MELDWTYIIFDSIKTILICAIVYLLGRAHGEKKGDKK
jgi:hypothetical protein